MSEFLEPLCRTDWSTPLNLLKITLLKRADYNPAASQTRLYRSERKENNDDKKKLSFKAVDTAEKL